MKTDFTGIDFRSESISDYHLSNLKKDSGRYMSTNNHKNGLEVALRKGLFGVVLFCVGISMIDHFTLAYNLYIDILIFRLSFTTLVSTLILSFLVISFLVTFENLSEAKLLDKALKRSSKWFSTTFKSVGAALIAADKEGNIIFMNPVAERLIGSPLGHVIGMPVIDVCHIFEKKRKKERHYRIRIQQVLEEGVSFQLNQGSFLQVADGSELQVMGNAAPIKDEKQKVIGVVLILHDLTEFKAIEEHRMKLAAVIDQSDDAVVITDEHGVVEYVNPSFVHLTGYDRTEVVGKEIRALKDTNMLN